MTLFKAKFGADVSMTTSLDHSMWYHAPFRVDEWMLWALECHRVEGGRALVLGRLYDAAGVLAVTVAQEGVVRLREDRPLSKL